MATNFLTLVNGVGRMQAAPGTTTIYDQRLTVVTGTAANTNQVTGPITSGVSITLPASGTYVGSELQIYLNGQEMESVADFNTVGTGTKTQISFTFQILVGDKIDFKTYRGP